MNGGRGAGFREILAFFGMVWVVTMIMAFPSLLVANGIFKVPLSEVVNVKMALIVFVVWIGLAITGINTLLALSQGHFEALVPALILAAFLVVWPFGPIAACELYAWLSGQTINSFVYNDLLQNYAGGARALSAWLGWAPPVAAGAEAPPAGAFGLTLQELFVFAIAVNIVIGVILALIGYRRRRMSFARAGR